MENQLPIVCTLTDTELEHRRKTTLDGLVAQAEETRALETGYAFRFGATDMILEEIVSFIQKERRCCRFLRFDLQVMPDEGPVWLELTGPEGTKEFLEAMLPISR